MIVRCFYLSVICGFSSHLFTQIMAGIEMPISARTRSMSCTPDMVGSVTMGASEAPVMEAMTGQAIPGGPSTISHGLLIPRPACAPASDRRHQLPNFQPYCQLRILMGPKRDSETNHSPHTRSGKSIACTGHPRTHTPHPSQESESIAKAFLNEPW